MKTLNNPILKKKEKYLIISIIFIASILLLCCNQLDKLLYLPEITPLEWLESQPYIEIIIFSQTLIIVQPSSTVFVYVLGFLTIAMGGFLVRKKTTQAFVSWWGIALILWGIGAVLAGTSYQTFSYEIKCTGKPFCIWTSLWENFYLIFSVGSVNAMLIAQTRLDAKGKWNKKMEGYAFGNFLIYIIIVVIGSVIPIQFLISFELMLLFLAPTILFLLISNVRESILKKVRINRSLIIIWVSLIVIIGLYFLYYILGITEALWEQGIWFSENDVLHISLLLWMIYIYFIISKLKKMNIIK
ncbi:MAG: hypothetical protein MUP85_16200 [Candidatus Lokiarchaeota archaeon]|nr:hypothetical protein [Candidatus Lokiarchaeota archaeon]